MRFQPYAVVESNKGRYGVLCVMPEEVAETNHQRFNEVRFLREENKELRIMNDYLRKEVKKR